MAFYVGTFPNLFAIECILVLQNPKQTGDAAAIELGVLSAAASMLAKSPQLWSLLTCFGNGTMHKSHNHHDY